MYNQKEINMIKRANKRIKSIETEFNGESWATKKLKSKLQNQNNILKSGLISTRKNVSEIEKKATLKAVKQFLESETSTLTGIKRVEKRIKSNIKDYTSDFELSKKEIDDLYNLYEDKDFQDLSKYIPPSDLHILIVETKKRGGTNKERKEFFINQIKTYAEFGNDMDISRTINKLYNKIK